MKNIIGAVGLMAGAAGALAQGVVDFGAFSSSSQTPQQISLDIPAGSASAVLSATFAETLTFTPTVNNPVAGTENYTINIPAFSVTLSSVNGYLATDPLTLNFGPTTKTVAVSYPYPTTTVTLDPLTQSASSALTQAFAADTADTMILTWNLTGGPTVFGGKGATINNDTESLTGTISMVPETGEFAGGVICGLMAFGGWMKSRKR